MYHAMNNILKYFYQKLPFLPQKNQLFPRSITGESPKKTKGFGHHQFTWLHIAKKARGEFSNKHLGNFAPNVEIERLFISNRTKIVM